MLMPLLRGRLFKGKIMQIYQTHPEHGRHIAETSLEAKANIKEGWKTTTEKAYYEGITKELKAKKVKIIENQKAALAKAEAEMDD
jgi:hypothetical protein